jgi:hypothetical protein
MSSSFVLSHQPASTYRNVRLGGLIPCGLAEGHFEQPDLKNAEMSSSGVVGRESPSTYRLVRLRLLPPCGLAGSHFEQPASINGRIIHDRSLAGQEL